MEDPRTVAELLAAVDDRSAWEELVNRYCRLVWSVARSFHLDDAATADVTQAVWLRLLEHRDRIRDPERLAGWLATTTRNEALGVARKSARNTPVETIDDRVDPTAVTVEDNVVGAIDDAELKAQLWLAFDDLPERCQQLLRLLTAEPKIDYATIAELTGTSIGSIGPTRARCLTKLRTLLVASGGRDAALDKEDGT